MPDVTLTPKFIGEAINKNVWDLGNEVLYKLCADYPDHSRDDAVIAKIWLIGRSYAAAIERRKIKDDAQGDDFYEKTVVQEVTRSRIDKWFEEIRKDTRNNAVRSLSVHKKLTDLLYKFTVLEKRSLASKYLHFHFPTRFFIFPRRAKHERVGQPDRLDTHRFWLPRGRSGVR
jgi:hypothetical protein